MKHYLQMIVSVKEEPTYAYLILHNLTCISEAGYGCKIIVQSLMYIRYGGMAYQSYGGMAYKSVSEASNTLQHPACFIQVLESVGLIVVLMGK